MAAALQRRANFVVENRGPACAGSRAGSFSDDGDGDPRGRAAGRAGAAGAAGAEHPSGRRPDRRRRRGLRRPARGRAGHRPEGQLRPARLDRLPRAPDAAVRGRAPDEPGRGLRPQDRPRRRPSRAADAGGRLHHGARRRRAEARRDLRAAGGDRRGQDPGPARAVRRLDPVADRRARPGLRLPPRCLRLRAIEPGRLRRRGRVPQGGAPAGRHGSRRHQDRRHRRGLVEHRRRRRPAVHQRRDQDAGRDRPSPRPAHQRPRPRHGRNQRGAEGRHRLDRARQLHGRRVRSASSWKKGRSTRPPSSPG